MATTTTRGKSYRIRVSCGYDLSGKQIVKSTTWTPEPGMGEKQIEKELHRQTVLFEERCKAGQVLDGNIRFSDFAEKWLVDYAEKNLKTKTVDRYRALLIRINEGIGHIKLNKIKPHHIITFMNNLSEGGVRDDCKYQAVVDLNSVMKEQKLIKADLIRITGLSHSTVHLAFSGENVSQRTAERLTEALHKSGLFAPVSKDGGKLSSRTQLHYYRLIHAILTDAVQWQVIPDNPCERVKPPSVKPKEAEFLDDVQTARLLQYLEEEPFMYQVLIRTALYTGLRRGELLGLKWADVDFKNNNLNIFRTLLYSKDKGIFEDTPKTTSSIRVLKFSSGMMETLRTYQVWQEQERLKLGDKWNHNDYLFTRWNGEPLRPDTVSDWFRKFIAGTDLPPVSLKSLRHTSATLQIMNGIPLKTVSARLGHSKTSTTGDIYSHAIKSADAVAADVLDGILKPAGPALKRIK